MVPKVAAKKPNKKHAKLAVAQQIMSSLCSFLTPFLSLAAQRQTLEENILIEKKRLALAVSTAPCHDREREHPSLQLLPPPPPPPSLLAL